MSMSHYSLSDTKIWFDFSCVMKVKHLIFEWLWDSTKGSTLHFAKSIQVSFMLFLIQCTSKNIIFTLNVCFNWHRKSFDLDGRSGINSVPAFISIDMEILIPLSDFVHPSAPLQGVLQYFKVLKIWTKTTHNNPYTLL